MKVPGEAGGMSRRGAWGGKAYVFKKREEEGQKSEEGWQMSLIITGLSGGLRVQVHRTHVERGVADAPLHLVPYKLEPGEIAVINGALGTQPHEASTDPTVPPKIIGTVMGLMAGVEQGILHRLRGAAGRGGHRVRRVDQSWEDARGMRGGVLYDNKNCRDSLLC